MIPPSPSSGLREARRLVASIGSEVADRAREDRHAAGSYHTPFPLAERVLGLAIDGWSAPRPLRVCDPCVGGGAFLVAALAALGSELVLAGRDLDERALAVACSALAVLAPSLSLSELKLGGAEDPSLEAGGFDLVLGNPPWLSYSGRQAEVRHQARPQSGWPSLHGLLLEGMARLVAPGGRLGVLVPAPLTDLPGYQATRAAVEALVGPPIRVLQLGESAFPGVTYPVALLVFARGVHAAPTCQHEGQSWAAPSDDRLAAALVAQLAERPRFPTKSFGDPGVHTGNAAKLVLGLPGEGPPLREGRCLQPYHLEPARRSLRLGLALPEGKYWRSGALERYRAVPILLRQTAPRPIAARHSEPSYFRNSLLACYGVEGLPCEIMLAILNSELIARIHRHRFRDGRQRSFPQLKVGHLRALPAPDAHRLALPWPSAGSLGEAIIGEVQALESGAGDRARLEALVAILYDLPAALAEELERCAGLSG